MGCAVASHRHSAHLDVGLPYLVTFQRSLDLYLFHFADYLELLLVMFAALFRYDIKHPLKREPPGEVP